MMYRKNEFVKDFLYVVDLISDKAYQERVWIRVEGPECDDLGETYNEFFPFVEVLLDREKNYFFTEMQHKLVVELRNKLDKFEDNCILSKPYKTEEQLINLPEWQEIRDLAKKVCKSFNYERKP